MGMGQVTKPLFLVHIKNLRFMDIHLHKNGSYRYIANLVAGFNLPTPLKNDGVKVSWDDKIPNISKNKKCSKPPTRYILIHSHI